MMRMRWWWDDEMMMMMMRWWWWWCQSNYACCKNESIPAEGRGRHVTCDSCYAPLPFFMMMMMMMLRMVMMIIKMMMMMLVIKMVTRKNCDHQKAAYAPLPFFIIIIMLVTWIWWRWWLLACQRWRGWWGRGMWLPHVSAELLLQPPPCPIQPVREMTWQLGGGFQCTDNWGWSRALLHDSFHFVFINIYHINISEFPHSFIGPS